MKQYRDNNPAFDYTIEAEKVTQHTVAALARELATDVVVEIHPETQARTVGLNVRTAEGMKRASEADNDFVIRNSKGEFFVMGEQTFLAHYVTVEEYERDMESVEGVAKRAIDLFKQRGGKRNGE